MAATAKVDLGVLRLPPTNLPGRSGFKIKKTARDGDITRGPRSDSRV